MDGLQRVTEPLLDVLQALVDAARRDEELHGWAIIKSTGRHGPTVYGVLDRLEDADWITGAFEERNPEPGRPPRRFYRLSPDGVARAEQLLVTRRPTTPATARPAPATPLLGALKRACGMRAAQ